MQIDQGDLVNMVKKEKQAIEDKLFEEQAKNRHLHEQLDHTAHKLHFAEQQNSENERRGRENEAMRIQLDRLSAVEAVNRRMKDQKKDDDFEISTLRDNLKDAN